MTDTLQIQLCGEVVELLPERAVYWPDREILLLADVHLGKDQVFRRHGMAVPNRVLLAELARLRDLIESTGTRRLIVLGDWVHGRPQADEGWVDDVGKWRHSHPDVRMDVVLGNHDRAINRQLEQWSMQGHRSLLIPPFDLHHDLPESPSGYVLSGHIHPGVRLRHSGDSRRVPVLWQRRNHAVLPAFGRFTGLEIVRPGSEDSVYLFAGGRPLQLQ